MIYLKANWPAPHNISALTTLRSGGVSQGPYGENNLALHVGDDLCSVTLNRQQLQKNLNLPNSPAWLEQTHSNTCVVVEENQNRIVDAAVTRQRHIPLAILTADCLPILLCDKKGSEIAAIHAGWRGLAAGIIENTLDVMQSLPGQCMAWIGPAICQQCFEIGQEVHDVFLQQYPFSQLAFEIQNNHWHANLAQIAELVLREIGVTDVYQSLACTHHSPEKFYSYRYSEQTGRMASLIWFNDSI